MFFNLLFRDGPMAGIKLLNNEIKYSLIQCVNVLKHNGLKYDCDHCDYRASRQQALTQHIV